MNRRRFLSEADTRRLVAVLMGNETSALWVALSQPQNAAYLTKRCCGSSAVSEDAAPERIAVVQAPEARTEVRAIDVTFRTLSSRSIAECEGLWLR